MLGRKVHTWVVETEGRDRGGIFTLTEMSAVDATDLCLRAMQMVARGGVDIPPHIFSMGVAGLVTMGAGAVLAGLGKTPWYEVKPLLDALLPCVTTYRPPTGQIDLRGWQTISQQIQEPTTILQLYEEVVSLHLGFSLRERLSSLREAITTMMAASTPNMPTSTDPSPPSSEAASPA
jgi:hypothetical protein